MNLTETPIRQTVIYEGKIITVRVDDARLPNGKTAKREVVEHPGGVCIAALTDAAMALALLKSLPNPEAYMASIEVLDAKAKKLKKRQDEAKAHQRNVKKGKK